MVKPGARHVQGRIRIIAGTWRGRRIEIPEGTAVRPTPDRVRETVFNWLRESLVGARCLDLFAGTGALAFEALSRGAAEAWLVEQDAQLVESLRATAGKFGTTPRIVRRDVLAFLREPPAVRFDVAFLDPPYAAPLEPLLEVLPPWLAPRALVYVERPRSAGLPTVPSAQWVKQSHAGAVEYGLLRFEEATMPRQSKSEAQSQ
ncbi:MAG TPA: 16S rRNA (guanine(966)-N(2))-methyltransferase RsmD [Gammaproteobacteria bacterium]|nr:16S rRNA (guanine(966)-N(2))-methyltransferase RsmD [Gammaproteobacteria bacterium]